MKKGDRIFVKTRKKRGGSKGRKGWNKKVKKPEISRWGLPNLGEKKKRA